MKKDGLPPRVYAKNGAYWHVAAQGKKRIWTRLCALKDGLPAMYRALADLAQADVVRDTMPSLIADWLREVGSRHSVKTQANNAYQTRTIMQSFVEFRARDVTPPDVVDFLKHFRDRPRTYNAYRAMLRELMRYAEERGLREPGSNPVDSLRTMTTKARDRYITDSELRRIKVAALVGADGKRTRSGQTICALIDMAYLTGQRIGDLLTLEWSDIGKAGIAFDPAKVAGSTGAKVLIEWTPRLRDVVDRLRALPHGNIKTVFATQEGQPYTYWGASTAWRRAVARAGVKDCHFHDLRAKALTDVDRLHGVVAAQRMGAHSTQSQTADYVRHKTAIKTSATR